jgi:hypothetical protein
MKHRFSIVADRSVPGPGLPENEAAFHFFDARRQPAAPTGILGNVACRCSAALSVKLNRHLFLSLSG